MMPVYCDVCESVIGRDEERTLMNGTDYCLDCAHLAPLKQNEVVWVLWNLELDEPGEWVEDPDRKVKVYDSRDDAEESLNEHIEDCKEMNMTPCEMEVRPHAES